MIESIRRLIARFIEAHRSSRRLQRIVTCLAAIVIFGTTYALILPAITLDKDEAAAESGIVIETSDREDKTDAISEEAPEITASVIIAENGEEKAPVSEDTEADADDAPKPAETEVLPAQTFEAKTKDVKVSVDADAGAFPENTSMEVTPVKVSEVISAVEKAIGGEVKELKAVDITFKDAEGKEIEPKAEIRVKMTSDLIKKIDDPIIVHINDKGKGEIVKQTDEKKLDEAPKADEVVFDSDAFSVYAIVGAGEEAHEARVKYVFQNADGTPFTFKNTAGNTVDNQIIKNGETLENVGFPEINANDETFNGWYIFDSVDGVNGNLTGEKLSFVSSAKITIDINAAATNITARHVAVAPADNQSGANGENPDYTIYVRPSFGQVHYITFWNEVDGQVIYTRIQVPKGATYNIANQSAVPPDVIIKEDGTVEYVTYAFTGWSTEAGTYEAMREDNDTRVEITNTNITVNEDMEYFPIFRRSHWVNFSTAPVGEGATYVPPVYVLSGNTAAGAKPEDPVWEGHTFVGWFTTDETYTYVTGEDGQERLSDDPAENTSLSMGETAAGSFNFNQHLDNDVTLYAHWNAGTANYTIVYWQQLVTDDKNASDANKHYEYGGQENRIAQVTSTVTPGTVANVPSGFHINTSKSDTSTTILADGTAQLNVYLDRDIITMRYWRQSGSPGFNNGNWTNSIYTDSYTGLYGQTWEQAGYTGWPPPGDGYIWNYYNNSNGTTVRTFLGQFVLAGTERQPAGIGVGNQEVRYYKTPSNTFNVQFFLQNTDGSTYPTTTPYVGVGGRGGQFSFTEKFDGFTLDQYRVQTPSGWSNWQTATNGGTVQFSNNLQVRYKRLSYTLKFLDARNGTELLDVPSVEVVYGAALSDSRPQNINDPGDLTSPSPELVWTGKWYADQECTTEFDWSRTMPNHDIAVYVNWDVLWYWIKIDPDGGALRNTESTWVWKVKGDYVEEYHNVVRKFSEDPDGEYYYHYDEFNENDPHGTQPSTRRAEYLPISGNPNWQEDSYDGKRYKPDQSMYSFIGWYEIDSETGEVLGKYNFDGGVTGNTYIRAIWRTVGQYQVAYSAEGVNEDGTPLYTKDENGNFTTTRVTGSNPPVDALRYADKSNSSIREALTDPEGYVFNGWYYNGKVYSPGDAFTVISELDVTELDPLRDDTITIYPVFVSYENLPVKTTHIYWYSNTVDINGDPIVGVPANGEIVNTERDGELQINEKVPVMSINELIGSVDYYDGYTFLGWAKVADDGTAAPRDLWLTLESDGTYSMISENGHKITGITHIASDANLPYDNMVAMWEKKSYTVTVKKVVNGFDSDQEVPFAFAPGFTPNVNKQVTDENGNTFYQNTQENFGLAGRTTTIYPEETEPITFTSSKTYYEIPYDTRFSFTESAGEDYEVSVNGVLVRDAKGNVVNESLGTFENGHSFTVIGDMEITYTNTRCRQELNLLKIETGTTKTLPGAVFEMDSATSGWVKRYYISNDEGYLVPATPVTENGETTYTITPGGTPTFELRVGTYTLTEVKAPDGYNLISGAITLNVKTNDVEITQGGNTHFYGEQYSTIVTYEDGVFTLRITNSAGHALPMTGGVGTLFYTLSGLALMGGALVYGFRLRRRRERRFVR